MEFVAYRLIEAIYTYTNQRNHTNREQLTALYKSFIDLCERQLHCDLHNTKITMPSFIQFTTAVLWIISIVKAIKESDYQLAENNIYRLMTIIEGDLLCTE